MLDFVRDFLKYVDKTGIYDEYDKDTNKMITSSGVKTLIKQARTCMPEELEPEEAAKAMRDLTDEHRDSLIAAAGPRVIDLRTQFAHKMAANGGAHRLLEELVTAAANQADNFGEILETAATFVHAEEIFKENK